MEKLQEQKENIFAHMDLNAEEPVNKSKLSKNLKSYRDREGVVPSKTKGKK